MKHVDYPNAAYTASWVYQHVPFYLREDAFSEGLGGLLEAERKGLTPGLVVQRTILDFLRREGIGPRGAKISGSVKPLNSARHISGAAEDHSEGLPRNWRDLLTPQELAIIHRIYWDGDKAKDIAKEMNLDESRVSRIKKAALVRLGAAIAR